MLALLRRTRAPAAPPEAPAPAAAPAHAEAIRTIGQQASLTGREAAEVRGILEDTRKIAERSTAEVAALANQVQQVTQAQDRIGATADGSHEALARARTAVEAVGEGVSGIVTTLRQVAEAAGSITQIALQTRLVAFNASVEAKRAGEAGRGFGVVADAVKDLAAKVESSSKQIMSTVAELDARIESLAREIQVRDDAAEPGAFQRALADVQAGVASVAEASRLSRGICEGLNAQMETIESEMQQTGRALDATMERSEGFLHVSEQLIEAVAGCGVETEDTPYIEAAQDAARRIGERLEEALAGARVSEADLFDEDYRPIADTNPPQHTTRFTELADRLFPDIQERMLELTPKVVFCIAVDRNGYVPTHNAKYCRPQGHDVVWNTANSRYRRIFNDRTGLASARNRRPFLLQTYRRDMGGGRFVVMKEASAPILVRGRHWGGLRLAFQF